MDIQTYGLFYFLEGIAVAFFAIMAVQNLWNRDIRLRMILGGILLYWLAEHLVSQVFTSDFLTVTRYWSTIINALDMTAEPTCCFILMELCRPGWLTWRKVALHELPFVALGAAYVLTESELCYYALLCFFVLYGIGVFVATLYYIPRYNRFLYEHYSYEERINLRWLYGVLVTFFALMFVYAFCGMYDTVVGDCLYLGGSIICWSWICYCIWRQDSVLFELEASAREARKAEQTMADSNETEKDEATSTIAEVLASRFIQPKLFLPPALKLGDMAAAIGTNRTYLSRYLNDELHTTFYDYINGLRLDHAVELMQLSDYSVTAIAAIAGFNSYFTFRRTFIARFGVPPQEYKTRAMNNNS